MLDRISKKDLEAYFEPDVTNKVYVKDFLKILNGNVKNPHHKKNPSSQTEYAYFIVSGNKELNDVIASNNHTFQNEFKDLFYKSNWFGQFKINTESSIIVPYSIEILFNKDTAIAIENDKNRFEGIGGSYQLDKHYKQKTLITDISLDEMIHLFRNVKKHMIHNYLLDKLDKDYK
ncbi:hypothetical protein C0585_02890 [Candidatus Woesearchaeota archaeon]|nr:MAG: hypothetical protein C0585_02890 [Candidatus Woesearchaeota archaeon]